MVLITYQACKTSFFEGIITIAPLKSSYCNILFLSLSLFHVITQGSRIKRCRFKPSY